MQILLSLWQAWKKLAHRLGVFQSKVILSVFYLLLVPFGLFFSLFKDLLKMKQVRKSTWEIKSSQSKTLDSLKQQY